MRTTTVLVSYTEAGKKKMEETAELLKTAGRTVICLYRPASGEFPGRYWQEADEFLFICAAGIAVRLCASYIRSKWTDPAVVVMDEKGRFAIPVLSGHAGGANDLALFLAEQTGAVPVITTATDVNGRFAVDLFARRGKFVLTDRKKAKEMSARILAGEPIGFFSRLPVRGQVPHELVPVRTEEELDRFSLGLLISPKPSEAGTREEILELVPMNLTAGMGCRKGVSFEKLEAFLTEHVRAAGYDPAQVGLLASIDRKAEEPGLRQLARSRKIPFQTWGAAELEAVEEVSEESSFVKQITGVGNVCERAAILGSRGGALVLEKTAENGMTLALAAGDWSVDFDKIICDRSGTGKL